ncbi:MAG: cytochrome P450, partial [Gaiellales bacterium]
MSATFAESITVEALERDPYPIYARLRREPPSFVPAVNVWMLTRWADVDLAGSRPDLFTAHTPRSPVELTFGSPTVLTCDGEVHKELRASIDPKFRPRAVDGYVDGLIEPIAAGLLDRFAGRGSAELMAEYLEPISVLGLGQVLGLGDVDGDTLRRWFAGLAQGATNYECDPAKQA